MLTYDELEAQTLAWRGMINNALGAFSGREREMPPTWRNNALWHAGHLVTVLRMITFGRSGEPLGIDENYRKWFGRDSSPADWGDAQIPSFEQLRHELVDDAKTVFAAFRGREDRPYPDPFKTPAGVVLTTPAQGMVFSQYHDGIHFGMLIVLRRALGI